MRSAARERRCPADGVGHLAARAGAGASDVCAAVRSAGRVGSTVRASCDPPLPPLDVPAKPAPPFELLAPATGDTPPVAAGLGGVDFVEAATSDQR